ncbi:hypothetical protein PLICRDRAFT_179743 [Plicaturopsis crispa FD-325 SS-3]|uniref:Uncharacterized protein n=1 Tax=Plicaturopsis crispa FD-325 SS-3 TaxID=944288 RepID=A0A0C9T402_PLICR|nr:hypothetical protein PLICRDRAFT_179743 [Plicaturopsis crispa FD-325 SS-3]
MPKGKKKGLSQEQRKESHRAACAKYYLKNRRARISDVKARNERKRDQGCLCRGSHRDPFCGICSTPEPRACDTSSAFTMASSSRVVIQAVESWCAARESGACWLAALDLDYRDAADAGIEDAWVSDLEEEIAEGKRLLEGFVQWQVGRQIDLRQLHAYRISQLLGQLHVGIARREDYLALFM